MEYKPNDVFLNVIDFFGILVPGAVLLFLRGRDILGFLGVALPADKASYWVAFFVGSLLLGHFLTGVGLLLLNRTSRLSLCNVEQYYKEVQNQISAPASKHMRDDAYYRAYAFIRLNSKDGIEEIDRQVSEYKLFRALTIVFVIDSAFRLASCDIRHALASLAIAFLAWTRFAFLVLWTQRMAFEYYALLMAAKEDHAPQTGDKLA